MEQFIVVFLLAIVCLLLLVVMTAMYYMKHGSQFPCLLTCCCCLHITYVLDWGSSEVMAFSRRQKKSLLATVLMHTMVHPYLRVRWEKIMKRSLINF